MGIILEAESLRECGIWLRAQMRDACAVGCVESRKVGDGGQYCCFVDVKLKLRWGVSKSSSMTALTGGRKPWRRQTREQNHPVGSVEMASVHRLWTIPRATSEGLVSVGGVQ